MGIGAAIVCVVLGTTWSQAQQTPMTGGQAQHEQTMGHGAVQRIPTLPGQDAFGAIQEIVRILEADPATDWNTEPGGAIQGENWCVAMPMWGGG